MLFNSYIFILIFLPVSLSVYYLIGRFTNYKAAVGWLVAVSFIFYAWWNPAYLALLLFSILFNYGVGISLSNQTRVFNLNAKPLLIIGITVNLLLLGYFKYANFFVNTINTVASSSYHLETIILPLAISFFTFQQIAYLVDAYRGNVKERDFLSYCLFVSFFPQLISGPIVHHKEMMPQFSRNEYFKKASENILIGFSLFSIGLFKKVIIADSMGEIADPMFDSVLENNNVNSLYAWTGMLAYAFQIYFDFSAYSDMALGLARMFGIRLPFNFNSPYKAHNIFDFWNRWHMTLSRFMRSHVYLPLVRNKKIKIGHQASLIISMLLGGLWHGANWTFVIWGGMHAAFLLINHGWHQFRRLLGHDLSQKTKRGIVAGIFLTFIIGMFSRVFFRADSFDTALLVLTSMLGLQADISLTNEMQSFSIPVSQIIWFSMLVFVIWFMPNSQEFLAKYEPGLNPGFPSKDKKYEKIKSGSLKSIPTFSLTPIWALIIALIFCISFINMEHAVPFIYFQF